MRFDDSLKTVLAADASTAFGARSAFRQIVDLAGRRRIAFDPVVMTRLSTLRPLVPEEVRAASARALALADAPAALVGFFAEDAAAVAAPVLRGATLNDADWLALLPALRPAGRGVLRARGDLSEAVRAGLERFVPVDFALTHDGSAAAPEPAVAPRPDRSPEPPPIDAAAPIPFAPFASEPFVALGAVARELPIVMEALRRSTAPHGARPHDPATAAASPREFGRGFGIAELVDRIETFQRAREASPPSPVQAARPVRFDFETDADGRVRWVAGVARGGIVGANFASGGAHVGVDGVLRGAFRQRSGFADARLVVTGGAAEGAWRVSGVPMFDAASGRFKGMRGIAAAPRADQDLAGLDLDRAGVETGRAGVEPDRIGAEAMRRLVHELKTPANAIGGFAELIETEMLGEVPTGYRARASAIRADTADLVDAVEDLEVAARLETGALDLGSGTVALDAILSEASDAFAGLVSVRRCVLSVDPDAAMLSVRGDERAVRRLVRRLIAAALAAAGEGEEVRVAGIAGGEVTLAITRPVALRALDEAGLFDSDAASESPASGAPLLGTGFALRLVRHLAREIGGRLTVEPARLLLVMPAGSDAGLQAPGG